MPRVSEEQYAVWTRAIQAGDRRAYTALYDALSVPLWRYAWSLTHQEALCYDLLQEAFLKLWQIRDRLDPGRSVRALLFHMVRNLAYKHHRHPSNHPEPETILRAQVLPNQIDALLDAQALQERLEEWIAEMPPRRREVFELSRLNCLTHKEIAAVLDISPKTVNNHLVAALRYLRDRLHAYDVDLDLR